MKLTQRLAFGYIRTKFKLLAAISKKKAAREAITLFFTPLGERVTNVPPSFKAAESLQLTVNGSKIQGYRWNHPQPNKILILHGFSSAASKFEPYISPLVKKGYEVLAFDAPAHGNSEGKTVHALQYGDMIKAVLAEYGPIQGFIAHSFGGIAISLAMETIAHDSNTKIVLIAPATETTSAVDNAFTLLRLKDPAVRKEFDNIVYEMSGQKTDWFSIGRAMHNIKANVLWIHDEDDDITPLKDALQVKEKNHPHINFIITKGLGHARIYRDTSVKKAVIDFF